MKKIYLVLSLVFVGCFFMFSAVMASEFKEGEVIVKFVSPEVKQAADSVEQVDVEKKQDLGQIDANLYEIKDGKTVAEKVEELEKHPLIEYAEPNYIFETAATPNDTYYNYLWGMNNTGQSVNGTSGTIDADVDAPAAWDLESDATGIVVAVIDTGVNSAHPDLNDNMTNGYDYIDSDAYPYDLNGHGTHVAGTVAAEGNNNRGVTGMAWNATIMPIRVLSASGSGSSSGIAYGILYAAANGADVINMSIQGTSYSQTIVDALSTARDNDVVVVVAAGNYSNNNDGGTHFYPCDYNLDNIVCVAATNQNDALASFSNYGTTSVDVAAPGTNIQSTWLGDALKEDFEGGLDFSTTDLTASDAGWSVVNIPGYGNHVKGSVGGGANSYLTSDTVNLSGEPAAGLEFYYFAYASGSLAIEVFNGSSWVLADTLSISGGDSGDYNLDVTAYAGSNFKFRLRHDSSYTFYIDDVRIYDTREAYTALQGTSMASPLVAGLAALIRGHSPGLSAQEVKAVIEDNVDVKSGLASKVATGGRVNAHASLASIQDTTPPTGTISINSNATYTNNAVITLTLNASDNIGVQEMRFSNDNVNWSSWESYATSKAWTINASQGLRYVYVQFRDAAGYTTTSYDSILYDGTSPTTTLSPDGGSVTPETDIVFSVNETATIYYSTNGTDPNTSSHQYTSPIKIGSDTTFKYFAADSAGNSESIKTTSFVVFTPASIITAAGPGGGPHIRAFDYLGNAEDEPNNLFAYSTAFRGGVHVASCDIDADGVDEIIAGTGPGQPPYVRVFEKDGTMVSQFLAYAVNIEGGVYLACGDLDGNGQDEIITGVPEGYGPHVRVFDGRNGNVTITAGFFAYDPWVRTGIRVAAGDLDGDGKDEIITGTGYGAGTHVRTFSGTGESLFTPGFFIYGTADRTGINVGSGDVNGDGKDEIITGSGYGRIPEVKVYTRYGIELSSFQAYPAAYLAGVKVAAGDVDGDGEEEIITGTNAGGGPQVRVFEMDGDVINDFFAYDSAFRGGVDVAVGFLNN